MNFFLLSRCFSRLVFFVKELKGVYRIKRSFHFSVACLPAGGAVCCSRLASCQRLASAVMEELLSVSRLSQLRPLTAPGIAAVSLIDTH